MKHNAMLVIMLLLNLYSFKKLENQNFGQVLGYPQINYYPYPVQTNNNQYTPNINPLALLLNDPYINQYLNFLSRSSKTLYMQQAQNPSNLNNSSNNSTSENSNIQHHSNINPKDVATLSCDPADIYCLCKFHPRYKDCVCLAYPKSVVCSLTYCTENPNSYECNPKKCDSNPNDESCYCRDNMDSIRCKCKLNPVNKECFCLKFPFSHLCNDRTCQINPNYLFCRCRSNSFDPVCAPKFCHQNPKDPFCECIMDPVNENCKCLNDANSCPREQFIKSVVQHERKLRQRCNNNTLDDPNLDNIYNLYYPPCKNDPKNPSAPCLPYPPPPKPCNKNKKSEQTKQEALSTSTKCDCSKYLNGGSSDSSEPCLSDQNGEPCIKLGGKQKPKSNLKKEVNFSYSIVNRPTN